MAATPGETPEQPTAPEQPTDSEQPATAPGAPQPASEEHPAPVDPAAQESSTLPLPAQETAQAAKPDTRPRPEYGEYAPEGWEWKPEGEESAATPAAQGSGVRQGGAAVGAASPNVQGVPHNLGADLPRPSRKGASQGGSGAPYRAAAPASAPAAASAVQAQQGQAQQGGAPALQQKPANTADRVITILLLVFGAAGALYSMLALVGLKSMFTVLEDAPGVTTLTPPGWLDLTGKLAGLALMLMYVLVLVFSLRRLRARKIAFGAPLAAGIVAFITVVVIVSAAMLQTPELMTIMQDPEASTKLLKYLQGAPGA